MERDASSKAAVPSATSFAGCTVGSMESLRASHRLSYARPHDMTLNHTNMSGGVPSPPENCWSTSAWDNHAPTDAGRMEESAGGDYNTGRMDWDIKSHPWDWENITMVCGGRSGEGRRLPASEWGIGGCAVVTADTPGGGSAPSKDFGFSISLASETSAPSGVSSVSSGIPGLAASRGGGEHDFSLVKCEPDLEQGGDESGSGPTLTTSEQQRRLFLGLAAPPGPDLCEGGQGNGADENKPSECHSNGGNATHVVSGDSLMGLKLGRRIYFEDSGGGGGGQKGVASSSFNASPALKKQRSASPGMQVPRCQVEGCKADLTPAKDYHRRHKVCETHSKASKVVAAGLEQRFCQQCSRFHVLAEFDEGKRSCRRRLAGHNERRRKPHPDIVSTTIGSSLPLHRDISAHLSCLAGDDDKASSNSNSLLEHSCYLSRGTGSSSTSLEDSDDHTHPYRTNLKLTSGVPWSRMGTMDDESGLGCQSLQAANSDRQQSIFSTLSGPTADRLLMLLQSPKGQMAAPHVSIGNAGSPHQFLQGTPGAHLGQGLTLTPSLGGGGVVGSLEHEGPRRPSSQGLSNVLGLSNSSRALSLLSSQSWAPRPHCVSGPDALDLSQANVTLEQFVASNGDNSNYNRGPISQRLQILPTVGSPARNQQPHDQFSALEKVFPMHSRDLGVDGGLTDGASHRYRDSEDHHRNGSSNSLLSGLGGFEGAHSMVGFLHPGHEFRGLSMVAGDCHNSRHTIDLMQVPSSQVHGNSAVSHGGGHSQSHLSSSGQYADFTSLRPIESSVFSAQQL